MPFLSAFCQLIGTHLDPGDALGVDFGTISSFQVRPKADRKLTETASADEVSFCQLSASFGGANCAEFPNLGSLTVTTRAPE